MCLGLKISLHYFNVLWITIWCILVSCVRTGRKERRWIPYRKVAWESLKHSWGTLCSFWDQLAALGFPTVCGISGLVLALRYLLPQSVMPCHVLPHYLKRKNTYIRVNQKLLLNSVVTADINDIVGRRAASQMNPESHKQVKESIQWTLIFFLVNLSSINLCLRNSSSLAWIFLGSPNFLQSQQASFY